MREEAGYICSYRSGLLFRLVHAAGMTRIKKMQKLGQERGLDRLVCQPGEVRLGKVGRAFRIGTGGAWVLTIC
jgi:hypothetical protein